MDIIQIALKGIITALVFQFLRNFLDTKRRIPEIDNYLKFSWLPTLILFGLFDLFSFNGNWDAIFYNLLFAAIIYVTYKTNNIRLSRVILIAIIPLFFIANLNTILRESFTSFYKKNDEINENLYNFALFWMFGFGIYSMRQNKRENAQRLKDEEEKKQLEAQKNTLEYQVAERTAELTSQKVELEKTVSELKTTQTQLIHAEKMASLGELTAGIAHEIQNPLNFVNNFSEVSVELCQELNEHIESNKLDKNLIKDLINDLSKNQEKIATHGKRAANIVKGMLQHSRRNSGEKELTDINALADEYLHLSYHGLRAKDKNFNADFKTDLDPNLQKVEVIPQDFGRVLLNLINNAFYACTEQNRSTIQTGGRASYPNELNPKINEYKPTVTVSTQQAGNQIIINIKDNGSGMSPETKTKIFQPFFTTKPTGQGTGLGLSLAYDIVTKGHGGTIDCVSEVGVGTEFVIRLPII